MNELITKVELGQISANFNELKAQLKIEMQKYDVVFEDIAEAKETRAKLNKLKDAIETERKRIKKIYEEPLKAFENEVKSLLAIIDAKNLKIDEGIKTKEEQDRNEKREEVKAIYQTMLYSDIVPFERIEKKTWYNITTTLASIKRDLAEIVEGLKKDIETIKRDFAHLLPFYLEYLDFEEVKKVYSLSLPKQEIKAEPTPIEPQLIKTEPSVLDDFPSATKTYIVEVPEAYEHIFIAFCLKNNFEIKEKE